MKETEAGRQNQHISDFGFRSADCETDLNPKSTI